MMDSLGIPPGNDFMFQLLPHLVGGVHDGTYDVFDFRTIPPTFNQNQATLGGAQFAVALLNGNLDGI